MVVRDPVLPRASGINLAADHSGLLLTLRRVSGHSASPGTTGPAAGERPVLPQCLENLAEDSVHILLENGNPFGSQLLFGAWSLKVNAV